MALSQGYTLTPERTISDLISIISDMDKHRKRNNPTLRQPATRDTNPEEEEDEEEEEEDKGIHVYMDKHVQLSSGESSCRDSGYVAGNSRPGAPGDSVFTVEAEVLNTEFEVKVTHVALDQDDAKSEGGSFIPGGGQTGGQRHVIDEVEEEEKEEVCDSSGNINLFSVTLAALAVCEEKEKEEQKPSNQEPILPTDLKRTLSHTDSPTESDDQTTVPLMLPTQEHFTGFEGRHADTLSDWCDGEIQHEEEEEEEEEEFSGYIRHT